MDGRSDQPRPDPEQGPNSLQISEAAGEKPEAGRGWFVRFEERSCPRSIEVRGDAAAADGEAVARHPGLPGALTRVATPTSRFFRVDETA